MSEGWYDGRGKSRGSVPWGVWFDEVVLADPATRQRYQEYLALVDDLKWGSAEGQRRIDNPDLGGIDWLMEQAKARSAAPRIPESFQLWVDEADILAGFDGGPPFARYYLNRWVSNEVREDRRGKCHPRGGVGGRSVHDEPEGRTGEEDHQPAPAHRRPDRY